MTLMSIQTVELSNSRPPVDESLYSLTSEEAVFFKSQTGIDDDETLKQHILAIQKKAYEVYRYPCIWSFGFTKMKIARMPIYPSVLELCQVRQDAILLDIGCCFGNDTRKAVADGWPVQNVIASDLRQAFWDFGHELFKTTPETFPAAFLAGDVFDPTFLSSREPFAELPTTFRPVNLGSLKSLTPLQGHVSAIFAGSFFHLFGEDQQLELARRLAALLSPLPGSVIFGIHVGLPEKGGRLVWGSGSQEVRMFSHSAESWRELWQDQVFEKHSVKVEARLRPKESSDPMTGEVNVTTLLIWSVTVVEKGIFNA